LYGTLGNGTGQVGIAKALCLGAFSGVQDNVKQRGT
jgi:hypothetical protein